MYSASPGNLWRKVALPGVFTIRDISTRGGVNSSKLTSGEKSNQTTISYSQTGATISTKIVVKVGAKSTLNPPRGFNSQG